MVTKPVPRTTTLILDGDDTLWDTHYVPPVLQSQLLFLVLQITFATKE